ncbi:hypothetical protein FHL15_005402 [Xylaria flabelliformis]|uniref:Uncharacterized protein n=1 Tax=Xylaria flabelliformis TaxID=2512241 RepID=A0A553I0K2_9PEZI|nr:hypothetical protein FHL15_005402 [Xylaria flabelliformis]
MDYQPEQVVHKLMGTQTTVSGATPERARTIAVGALIGLGPQKKLTFKQGSVCIIENSASRLLARRLILQPEVYAVDQYLQSCTHHAGSGDESDSDLQ